MVESRTLLPAKTDPDSKRLTAPLSSHQPSGEPPHLYNYSLLSPPPLNGGTSTTIKFPKDQLEVCLWRWLQRQRQRPSRVSPCRPPRGSRTFLLCHPFPLFFCCQSSLFCIGVPAAHTHSGIPLQLHLGKLLPHFFPTHDPPIFQMVFFKRTNKATDRL